MRTKVCFKCEEELPIVSFYRHPMMADGHLNKCKSCTRYDVRENRKKRKEYYDAYDRKRSKRPDRIASIQRSREPHKALATKQVYQAVKQGKLRREPCVFCGATEVEAHHHDYAKPLDVMWLCRRHHAALHRAEVAESKF